MALRRPAAVLVALALVGAAPAATVVPSGLRGSVTRPPTKPVCAQNSSCSAPAANAVLLFTRNATTVRTRTDARGRYRVTLAPGWWAVRAGTPRIGSGVSPRLVRVVAGRFRVVDLDIDTGIR